MKKKILFSILVVSMLVTACLCMSVAAGAASYTIGTADEFMDFMNAGHATWSAGNTYTLTANIDLTGKTQQPIGHNTTDSYFVGTFDGAGYTISGIDITDNSATNVGLFGCVMGTSTIKNLTVEGTVSSTKTHVGGLIGTVGSDNVTIDNCVNKCTVTGAGQIGGIVGYYVGKTTHISNCRNEGSINSNASSTGGIVGWMERGTVENCVNEGTVTSTTNWTGGIVGLAKATSATIPIEIIDCTNSGSVSGTTNGGGIVGYLISDPGNAIASGCTNAADATLSGTGYLGGIAGSLELRGTGTLVSVSDCVNNADISISSARVGGIAGNVYALSNVSGAKLEIEDCENNGDISGTTQVAGIGGYFTGYNAPEMVVTGCQNNGAISGTGYIGGIGGQVLPSTIDPSSTATCALNLTFEKCTNTGSVTSSNTRAAGIVGEISTVTANKENTRKAESTDSSVKILYCKNKGTVTATGAYAAGIVALFYGVSGGNASSDEREIGYCWNAGDVVGRTDGSAEAGGIAGYIYYAFGTNIIHDCLNTGAISGYSRIGGCFGVVNSGSTKAAAGYCLNKGTVTGVTNTNIGDVAGFPSAKILHDCYYTQTAEGHMNVFDSGVTVQGIEYTADAFDTLNTLSTVSNTVWVAPASPELAYFHTHTFTYTDNGDGTHAVTCSACGDTSDVAHTYENGECTLCHAEEPSCQHDGTTHDVVTLAATCAATGLKNVVCDECDTVIETVVLPIDPANHVDGYALYLAYNKNGKGEIDYCCDVCDGVVVEDTSDVSTVYVSASGYEITPANISAGNLLGTSARPFANFTDAMTYAALPTKAMTVNIKDSAVVPASYASPACAHLITITGGDLNFNTAPRRFFANGDVTFENITFKTEETATTANEVGGVFFFGQNHNFTFGEGIVMGNAGTLTTGSGFSNVNNVKAYVLGGFGNDGLATPATMDTHLTVRSGEYWFIGGWNRNAPATKGTGHLTVGKTNPSDTLITNYLVPYSTTTQNLTADSEVTVVIDGEIDARLLLIGTQNAGSADKCYTTNYVLMGDISPNYPTYNGGLGFDLTGTTSNKVGVNNVYVDERVPSAIVDSYAFFGDGASVNPDTAVANMGYPTTYYTYVDYCANVLGGHTGDNCTRCGLTHALASGSVWSVDGTNGGYKLICAGCGDALATGVAEPVVYLDPTDGNDNYTGLTAALAVKTMAEAFGRLDATGGRIVLASAYVVSSANVNLPAHTQMITMSSVLDGSGNPTTGIRNTLHGSTLNMNGPMTFENIVFNNERTTTRTTSGTYYNIMTLAANWNDFTIGNGVHSYGGMYVIVGGNQIKQSSGSETKTVNIHLHRVTAGETYLPDGDTYKSGFTPFYERVFLMDRYNTLTSTPNPVGPLTQNKTVNATLYNITAGSIFYATTSSAAHNAQTENCTVNLTIRKNTDSDKGANVSIGNLTVDNNMKYSTGSAYLDNFTLNIEDNVSGIANLGIWNVKNATLNVSDESDGRTAPFRYNITFGQTDAYKAGEGASVTETVTANYGTHSLQNGMSITADEAYTFNDNVVNECTWDNDVTYASVTEYTCTACSRTKPGETFVYDADAFAAATTKSKYTGDIMSYKLRVIVRAYVPEDKTVDYYGIAMLPTGSDWTFEDDSNYVVKNVGDLESGATFRADIVGIPAAQSATPIYAWAFVKYADSESVVTVPIGTFNVQDYIYPRVEG